MAQGTKELQQLKGIGTVLASRLVDAGLDSMEKLAGAERERLEQVPGLNRHDIPRLLQQAAELAGAGEPVPSEAADRLRQRAGALRRQVEGLAEATRGRLPKRLTGRKGKKLTRELVRLIDLLNELEHKPPERAAKAGRALSGSTPLWLAARELLAQRGKEFFLLWKKVARGFGRDDIHDLRVASRRLREAVALFAPCFPEREVARLRKRLKTITGALGALRNTDEALLFFSTLPPEEIAQAQGEVAELTAGLTREREAGGRELKRTLRALRPAPLRQALKRVRNRPRLFDAGVDPFRKMCDFGREALGPRERTVNELIPRAEIPEDHPAQHRLRIAVKRLRYRTELLVPFFDREDPELVPGLKRYQELLGKLHDLDLFAELVTGRLTAGAGRERLEALLAARRRELHHAFVELLRQEPLDRMGERGRNCL